MRTKVLTFTVGGALLGAFTGLAVALDHWGLAWLAWGVIFGAIEGLALFNSRDGDTLSEHVWAFIGVHWRRGVNVLPREATGWTKVRRLLVLSFMAWLTVHFMTGGWV